MRVNRSVLKNNELYSEYEENKLFGSIVNQLMKNGMSDTKFMQLLASLCNNCSNAKEIQEDFALESM